MPTGLWSGRDDRLIHGTGIWRRWSGQRRTGALSLPGLAEPGYAALEPTPEAGRSMINGHGTTTAGRGGWQLCCIGPGDPGATDPCARHRATAHRDASDIRVAGPSAARSRSLACRTCAWRPVGLRSVLAGRAGDLARVARSAHAGFGRTCLGRGYGMGSAAGRWLCYKRLDRWRGSRAAVSIGSSATTHQLVRISSRCAWSTRLRRPQTLRLHLRWCWVR